MSKLGVKIIISYILIVIIATIVFIFSVKSNVIETIKLDKKSQLNTYLDEFSEDMYNVLSKNQDDLDIFLENYYTNTTNTKIKNETYKKFSSIFSKDDEKVFINLYNDKRELLYVLKNNKEIDIDNYENEDFLILNRDLYVDDKLVLTLELFCETKKIQEINDIIYDSIYSAFLFTMLITLIISLMFEMSIVGPMSDIRENIKNISLFKKVDWKQVKTRDELEVINKELYYMTTKLQKISQKQKEFFQNTSHELKTPLMSIQGYAEAIKDDILDQQEQENALDIIIDESKRLSNTLTSVIYMSYLEKGEDESKAYREKINIYNEIERFKKVFEIQLLEENIIIQNRIDKSINIMGQKERVDTVINNLLSNAIRYAKTTITFNSHKDINNIHFTISDDGQGIKSKDIYKIFNRFYKGNDGKSGLGLSIVKAVVSRFDAEVFAYNSKYGGAVIEIVVPKNGCIEY